MPSLLLAGKPDRIFSRDGALMTSAGVTAGINLALEFVKGSRLLRRARLRQAAARCHATARRPIQPLLNRHSESGTPLRQVEGHVMAHVAVPFPVERLAKIAGMPRSVARLFVKKFELTPHDFVGSVRLNQARNLLEATDLALKAIAFDCGFAGSEQMQAVFLRRLGLSPIRYRENFRKADRAP